MTTNEVRCVVTLLKLRLAGEQAESNALEALKDCVHRFMESAGGSPSSHEDCQGMWLFADPTHAVESSAAALALLAQAARDGGLDLRMRLTADCGVVQLTPVVQGPALEGALEAMRVAHDQILAVTPELLRHLREDLRQRVWRLAPIGEPAIIPPPQTLFAYDWDAQLGRSRDMPMRPNAEPLLPAACLELRQGEQALRVYVMDCPVSVGRDDACRLRLSGSSASRFHGRIEFDGERFVFVDDSRNGSYLMTAHGDEIFLRGERAPLSGAGVISPGLPLTQQPGEVLRYRCHRPLSEPPAA